MTMFDVGGIRSPEEREEILALEVQRWASQGWAVQAQSGTQATLTKGKHTSHLLHLVLTLVTLGLWLLVWVPTVIFGGFKTKLITVDEYGRVTTR